MRLLKAQLLDFRNIAEAQLDFSPTVNILVGANGQGKTNLLESLDYISLGRSFRGAPDADLVGFSAAAAHLEIVAEDEDGKRSVFAVGLDRQGRRRLRIDGVAVRRKSDLVGRLTTVVYDPRTVELVRGGPRLRRRYLDRGLSLLSSQYFRNLQLYLRALRQKGHLLREGRRHGRPLTALAKDLRAWNRELSVSGTALIRSRAALVRELEPLADQLHSRLSGSRESLELIYSHGVEQDNLAPEEDDFEGAFCARLDYIMEEEYQRGRCLAGPHLDDLDVRLDGVSLRDFGSQGETRTVAIALQLAQGEMIWRHRRVRPVLLFDDIFSELDPGRARRLQELTAKQHQVFIATAREEDVSEWRPEGRRLWRVVAGEVTRVE